MSLTEEERVKIYLSGKNSDKFMIVDKGDEAYALSRKWYLSHSGYAYARPKNATIFFHKVVKGIAGEIDHINHNRLDNRKSNLRPCTRQQNIWNSSISSRNKSGFKGVHWRKTDKRWCVEIHITSGTKKLRIQRLFRTREEAALGYNKMAKEYYGEFATVNVVSSPNVKQGSEV